MTGHAVTLLQAQGDRAAQSDTLAVAPAPELVEQIHFLRQLVNAIPSPIFYKDVHGRYLGCNKAFEDYTGVARENLVGKSVFDIAPLELAQAYFAADRSLLDDPGTQIYESKVEHADGRVRDVAFHKATFSTASGNIGGLVGVMLDVTERKTIERELELAAKVFESSAEGVIITDARRRILRVNRAFTEITQYTEAEIIGKSPRILRSGRHSEAFYAAIWKEVAEHDRWQGEIWNRRKDGELFPEWQSISAVRDNAGQITHYLAVFSDITQRKHAEERINHLIHFDALTGLPNRVLMLDRLEQALVTARRHKRMVAVLIANVDRLQNINKPLGHHVGDELLKLLGQRLSAGVRPGDTVSRHVGDEFAIVLSDLAAPADAARIAEKLQASVSLPATVAGHDISVTASFGISVYPDDGADAAHLLSNADAAMRHAKNDGGNNYQFYRAEMNAASLERLLLESGMRHALEREEFALHYQPQVDLESGRIIGMEALIRWRHPQIGIVPPARFIPIAEDTGMIVAIGEWVLLTACGAAKRWQEAGFGELRVSVNVSARQFRMKDLAQTVGRVLRQTGLEPTLLELELTESLIMQNPERAIETLIALKSIGIHVAVDDFGTGYSSLAYLKRFPIDKLKIDRSFVLDIPGDSNDAAIAQAVIALGRSMQLQVVAEGVETWEQLDFLRTHQCHAIQGYLYSPPVQRNGLCLPTRRATQPRGQIGPRQRRRRRARANSRHRRFGGTPRLPATTSTWAECPRGRY